MGTLAAYGMPTAGAGVLAHGGEHLPPLTAATALGEWLFAPVATVVLLAFALAYLAGMWRVARRHRARPWSRLRALSFLVGLATIGVALQSSVGVYDGTLFWMHMVQHLLLIMVAPLFLLAGKPITLLLHASRNPVHRTVKKILRSAPVSVVTHPLFAAALYALVIVGTHLTGLMNLVVVNPIAHEAEHVAYVVCGYLFFLPIIGQEPIRWRLSFPPKMLLLIVSMAVDTVTGIVLLQANRSLFSAYAEQARDWGPTFAQDIYRGGEIMWIGGDFLMLITALLVFAAWVSDPRTNAVGLGRWLESARRVTLNEHITGAGVDAPAATPKRQGETVDDDEEQLAAYNAYLASLARSESTRASRPSTGGYRSGKPSASEESNQELAHGFGSDDR